MKRKYYRYNSLGLSRNERMFFSMIISSVITLIKMIGFIIKGLYSIIVLSSNLIRNTFILYSRGYDVNELLDKFNNLTPRQFEIFMSELFKLQGYNEVILTQFSHDYGRDIILKKRVNNKIETTYVECKYYASDNVVGRDICFKLLGSMRMFNADKGIVCSTGKFHKNSIEVASKVSSLKLMGSGEIKIMLYKLSADQMQKIMFKLNNVSTI